MIIRRYFTLYIVAVACLAAMLCHSCSVEEPISAVGYTYTMRIDAVLNGFDASCTRSGYDWHDGAKLYVQFYEGENRVQGFAEYNETNDLWTVTTRTALSNVSSARCEAYYFGHSAEFVDVVDLSETVAVYQDLAGRYFNGDNGLTVSLSLTPRTGRIRFRGEVARSFTVSGINHLSAYEVSSNSFSASSESLSLTVSGDGYTPYIYVSFPESSRTLTIIDGNIKYTRECPESVLLSGRSGNMTLPTTASHDGWVMEDMNQIDDSAVAEAVDLGLSVMWASCNVGANSPEDYGGYYAWGETEEKNNYTSSTYAYYGVSIGTDISGTEYDVAHTKLGDKWRMPTKDELGELYEECTWQWTTINGINGYKVIGPNGNSIFLPAAGYRYGTDIDVHGMRGNTAYYWSSTKYATNQAYNLQFSSSKIYGLGTNGHNGYDGHSVRPVYGEISSNVQVSVATSEATNITASSVNLSGTVNGVDKSVTCGIIYGTSTTLSSTSGTKKATSSSGSFSISITGLASNTTYYYRAYIIVDGEYKYGDVFSFTTREVSDNTFSDKTYSVNGVSFKMIKVTGGTFTMGASDSDTEAQSNEKPAHQVTLSSYSIGETEVTQELWEAVMGSNPSCFSSNMQNPVENISWNDCQSFIAKLNELTGENFRLPTEAEWEYAARGGNVSQGYKYSGSNTIDDVSWCLDTGYRPQAVKNKQPNELGLYDMSGNVWEWCADWFGYYSSASLTNPTGASTGSTRVLRGGSWAQGASHSRVTYRHHENPAGCWDSNGLRLAL